MTEDYSKYDYKKDKHPMECDTLKGVGGRERKICEAVSCSKKSEYEKAHM